MTRTTTTQPKPLHFGVQRSDTYHDYSDGGGKYIWSVGLPDGREAIVVADRVEINAAGALITWQDTHVTKRGSDKEVVDREPQAPFPTVMLGAGAWTHCFVMNASSEEP